VNEPAVEHPDDDDFAELLAAASQGDSRAQQLICERYEPKVRIVARVLLGPALRPYLDSMDLVQSVHRCLLLGLRDQKFDISTPDKLIALANTIVRRKVARKWQHTRRQQRLDGASDSQDLVKTLSSLSSPETDPAQAAQFNDQLVNVCQNLTDVERRMLELRLDGFTSPEVAEQLGIHAVALRVRWTRLRKRLRESGIAFDVP
jgi:RNA polymerase sigma-70 factor (ECF subfamily)